jgi:hypothetical protein
VQCEEEMQRRQQQQQKATSRDRRGAARGKTRNIFREAAREVGLVKEKEHTNGR